MSKTDKGMCILGFKGNNFMRLELVELQLNGKDLVIGGENEQGKSSLLNAFYVALQGADAMKDLEISRPVRDGQDKASITLVLGPSGECLEMVKTEDGYVAPESAEIFFVTRKWVGDNMYLEVTTAGGAKYPSPQKMLDALVGKMFDPFEFSMLKGTDQKALLMKIVDLGGFDLDKYAADRKILYDRRTDINREVSRLDAVIKSSAQNFEGIGLEEIPAATILQEQAQAQEILNSNNRKRDELKRLQVAYSDEKNSLAEHDEYTLSVEKKIEDLKKHLEECHVKRNELEREHTTTYNMGIDLNDEVKKLVDPDLSIFSGKLADLEETNARVRAHVANKANVVAYDAELLKSTELSDQIKVIDKAKADALAGAAFPIEGLSIDEAGITFKGIPFGQCSTEEKIRICVSIAMALNPRLKVIRISRAESLDAKNFKIIKQMAAAGGYQLLMEKVGDPGDMGIIIEDGKVKES